MHKLHNQKLKPTENSTVWLLQYKRHYIFVCLLSLGVFKQVLVFMWVDSYFERVLYSAIPVYCIKLQEHVKLRIPNF